jgi:hypothetical protein
MQKTVSSSTIYATKENYLPVIKNIHQQVKTSNPLLYYTSLGHLILFLIFILLSLTDSRTVEGINTWNKPLKFAISIAIFTFTYGYFLIKLKNKWVKNILSFLISICMWVEISLITFQAGRGVPSHFNNSTPFDLSIFSLMGTAILINSLVIIVVFIIFMRKQPAFSNVMLSAIRWGMAIFIFANMAGAYMVRIYAHSVSVNPGSQRVPFFNWTDGDIRIAHFLGMHAVQLLPLAAYWMQNKWNNSNSLHAMRAMGFFYLVIVVFIFVQAVYL